MIYIQYVRPALEYISPMDFRVKGDSLQRVKNDVPRAIAGLPATCLIDFLLLETNIEPLKLWFKKNYILLRKKIQKI